MCECGKNNKLLKMGRLSQVKLLKGSLHDRILDGAEHQLNVFRVYPRPSTAHTVRVHAVSNGCVLQFCFENENSMPPEINQTGKQNGISNKWIKKQIYTFKGFKISKAKSRWSSTADMQFHTSYIHLEWDCAMLTPVKLTRGARKVGINYLLRVGIQVDEHS